MPTHLLKALCRGFLRRLGLHEALIKLKILRFAGFYILFAFRIIF